MAEIAVGLVIDKLIPLLTEEANLLRGVHREVVGIKRDLQRILAFLKDVDRMEGTEGDNVSDGIKVWVEELREAAFEIEDAIDEYTKHVAQRPENQQEQRLRRLKFIRLLHRISYFIFNLKPVHDIALKIHDLKQRVSELIQQSRIYGFKLIQEGHISNTLNNAWCDPRNDTYFLKETEVVGIESTRDELVGLLKSGSSRRTVISIVGMGGLGKTTLAHQVYNRVKGHFDCHAWVEVSQMYDKVELLRNLLKRFCESKGESVPSEFAMMDERRLITQLKDYLQGKRYVVVFDDVWNVRFWADVKNALPDSNEKNGRIVITTRLVKVVNFCKASSFVHIHQLQPLPQKKAWELFCNKAFQYELERHCPTHLETLSGEIVKRCEGLPLAIVVIAGLLSTKNKTTHEWRKLLATLNSELESNGHLASITKILSLSYYDLPYYLKSCFLYFGIFPEDCSIRSRRLIRLWIAEGFVTPKKDKSPEVVAEEYLIELINRSMVQVSEIDFDGKPRSCRIHDLLREIILKKMEVLSFCQVLSQGQSNFIGFSRRISSVHSSYDALENCSENFHVRSIFVFNQEEMPNALVSTVARCFKLLKVLDFEDAPSLDHLPEDIGSLFHLRYLSVRGTRVKLLPNSIGKMENLETLDLKQSLINELTAETNRLYKLRHLLASHSDDKVDYHANRGRGVRIQKGFRRLKALQKLYFVEANTSEFDVFKEIGELTELKKLGIKKLRKEDGRSLCGCIKKMIHLESLDIASTSEDEEVDLESMLYAPKYLQHLYLAGHLRKLPEWITELESLVKVRITWSKLEDDPLKSLQNLPNLLEIAINRDAYYGEELIFEEASFQKLKVLSLRWLSRLNSLVIGEGALRNLARFDIGPCPQLKEVPYGFQHLTNLKLLRFWEMPTSFLLFQDFQSLQSVPDVRFIYKIEGQNNFCTLGWIMTAQGYAPGGINMRTSRRRNGPLWTLESSSGESS